MNDHPSKIGILVPLTGLDPAFSIARVIKTQVHMLREFGHPVVLIMRKTNRHYFKGIKGVECRRCLPATELWDDHNKFKLRGKDGVLLKRTVRAMENNLKDLDIIITHDVIWMARYYIYNLAMRQAAKKLNHLRWLHWIHSPIYGRKPFFKHMANSKIIVPNDHKLKILAKAFKFQEKDVQTVFHIVDPRTENFLHKLTKDLIKAYDLYNSDIVQLYPINSARMFTDKKSDVLVRLFAKLKALGKKVKLIIANAYCYSDDELNKTKQLGELGTSLGLTDKELIFTSDFQKGKWISGLPHQVTLELFSFITNLFVLPSSSESFSLITMEAAQGKNLLVLNKNLPFLKKLLGQRTVLFFPFGAYFPTTKKTRIMQGLSKKRMDQQLGYLAKKIIKVLANERSLLASRQTLKKLSLEWVYKNQYVPLLEA